MTFKYLSLNVAIASALLIGLLTIIITYAVHSQDLSSPFKGGLWFGLVCLSIGFLLMITKIYHLCECNDNKDD